MAVETQQLGEPIEAITCPGCGKEGGVGPGLYLCARCGAAFTVAISEDGDSR